MLTAASAPRHAPGELSEYASDGKRKEKAPEDRQAFYSGFLGLALERNHSEGWAAYRYKAKFGVWPNGLRKEPSTPTNAVRQYDKYMRIKYVKGKQAEQ